MGGRGTRGGVRNGTISILRIGYRRLLGYRDYGGWFMRIMRRSDGVGL